MDTVKIGRYIAQKRKGLGLTQKQVAEKLGMSDKSVSKWERGVCLPDVSIYTELCEILGISLNEFFAGEDICVEAIVKQSEDNIIQIATDSKHRQNKLKCVIALLLVIVLSAGAVIGVRLYLLNRPQNYICAVDRESAEMKTAQLLSGVDGAYMYKYVTTDSFNLLTIYISKYESGKLVDKDRVEVVYEGLDSPENGMIVIVPDFDSSTIRLIISDDCAKLKTEIPILDGVTDRGHSARSIVQFDGKSTIKYDEEQGLFALTCGKNELRSESIEELEAGNAKAENDYTYYLSFKFSK